MAKKRNKFDTILKRAEKLFETGNYLLAEIEFKKARQKQNSPEIEEKLAACLKHTLEIKGQEFIKKGQKALGKNDLPGAISCFREAEALLHEPWISDKIRELEQRLSGGEIAARAEAAVRQEDYPAAADMYMELGRTHGDESCLARAAICLVKSHAFNKAVDLFGSLSSLDDAGLYHFGYALAKLGRYQDALARWEMVDSRDAAFMAQQRRVLDLAFNQLKGFLAAGADANEILAGTDQLLDRLSHMEIFRDNGSLIRSFEILADCCSVSLIAPLWESGDYKAAARLLAKMVSTANTPIATLCAATYYHLAEKEPAFSGFLSEFWFPAVYSNGFSPFEDDPETQTRIRQRLIRMAEKRISEAAGGADDANNKAAQQFETDKILMADLEAILREQGEETPGLWICPPGFAMSHGFSDAILALIRKNKDFFRDEVHYLETGACYSRAGEGFYPLKTGHAQISVELLEQMATAEPVDEFTKYALALVRFKFGKMAIENNDKNYLDYFDSTAWLFETAPGIEQQFSQEMMQYEGSYVFEYESVLRFLHQLRPSKLISEVYSFFMGQAAVVRVNMGKINNKQFMVALDKALGIDPENEFVIQLREEGAMEQELEALFNAMNKRKMGKAAALAGKSDFPEVRERFFGFIEQMMEFIQESGSENSFRAVEYTDLINACTAVDPSHPVINNLKLKIQLLGGVNTMNPYSVLGIGKEASGKEIIRAAAFEMRQRRHDAKTIALAQKQLMDPVSRACMEFLYWIDFEDAKAQLRRELEGFSDGYDDTSGGEEGFDAPCLTIFDGSHEQ